MVVTKAMERGELPHDCDPYNVIEDLVSLTYFRLLVTGRRIDDRVIERSVQLALRRHGAR